LWNKLVGGYLDDYAYSLILADDNSFLITGSTFSAGDIYGDCWFIKLGFPTEANEQTISQFKDKVRIYPNPLSLAKSKQLLLETKAELPETFEMSLYNLKGELISRTEINNFVDAKKQTILTKNLFDGQQFSTGVFLMKIEGKGLSEVKKLLILK